MTEKIIIDDCYFCENGTCNIYSWTCDYDWDCKDNHECKVKEVFLELQRLKQENEALRNIITEGRAENKRLIQECRNVDNYRKALEEIKEIAEEYKKEEMCRIPLGAIEMIINEVLGC